MAESTATLQAKLEALTHGRVDIMEDAETFKSTTQILREMADAWEYMTDIERASALELMGGKRQANILSSLISNFDIVEDVINTSLNSENSAIEENEKYMNSMQGRIDQLNNSLQSMWVNALDSDFLKFIISVADAFVQLTDEVGLFNMAIAAFMGRTAFKSQKFGILNWLQGQKGIISSTAPTNTAEAQAQDADTAATERNTAATNANIQAEQASAQASMQAAAADNAEAQAAAVAASADATETGASSAEAAAEQVEAASSIASATADAAEASSSMAAASADIAEAQASIQAASADTVEQAASNGAAAADAAEAAASGVSVLVGGLAAGTTAFKLFNAAATMGISLLAGMFISGLMEVVDELNVTSEEIQDAAKQAESAIQSLSGDFKKNEKFVSSNAKRFAELAQGVDVLNGKNVSLNTEEYNEFLNLSNQLADTFPSLSRVYDENGNAIVQLSGSTDTIVSSLENLLDVQRQLTQQKIVDNLPDLYAGVKLQSDNYLNEIKALESSKQHYDSMLKYIEKGNFENSISSLLDTGKLSLGGDRISTQMAADIQRALGDLGIDTILTPILDAAGNVESNMLQLLTTVTPEQIQAAKNNINVAIDSIAQEYNGKIDELSVDIVKATNENQANWSSLSSSIFSWLQTEPEFKILDDNMQSMVQTVINNLDYSALNFESWDKAQKWISENIIGLFSKKDIGNKVSEQLNNMFKLKSDFKAGDMGIDDYKAKLQEYVEFVKGLDVDPKVQENLLKMFGLDPSQIDLEKGKMHLGETIQEMKNHAAKLVTDEGLLGGLTYKDLQILFQVDANTTPAVSKIEDLRKMIKDKKIELTADFTVSNYADYAEDISRVSSNIAAYQEALENLGSGSFTMEDFVELIAQFPELADGVDVVSENFEGLSYNLAKAIKKSPDDLVDDLKDLKCELEAAGKETDAIDTLIDSLENMPDDALDGALNKYGSLIDQITAAKAAQEELNAAMSKNPNEGFETRGSAIDQMKKLMEQDAIGSESELWDIAEAYGFDFESAQSLRENADALYEFIRARESWFKTDKDGNVGYEGTENFIEAAEKAIQSEDFKAALQKALGKEGDESFNVADYIKWDYENGVFDFDFDNANWDAIVQALAQTAELTGLTSDEFTDLLTQIGMFFDVNWQDASDVSDYMQTVVDGSGTTEEKISAMTKAVEKYVEKALGKDIDFDNLTEDVINGLGEIDPEIKQLLFDYLELKKTLEEDPLSIKSTIDKEGADGLLEIEELLGVIKKNGDGTIAFDDSQLTETLEKLGYTSEEIDKVIKKIEEYNRKVKQPPSDPLGINNFPVKQTVSTIVSGLDELGATYEATRDKMGNPLTADIEAESLITKLAEKGWTPSQIETYMAQLQATIESNNLDISINGDTSLKTIQDIVTSVSSMPETKETKHTTSTNADVVVPQINGFLDSIPRAIHTYHYMHTVNAGGSGGGGDSTVIFQNGQKYVAADGTAHAQGTAYKTGSWGAQETETALVGELGPELLVRNGRWTTIGQNGAEFTQIKKGDIIFNHKQTESLLKNGYVTGRGKAYAEGTAFASGTAYASGGGAHKENAYVFSDTSSKISSAAKKFSDAADEFEETFDWIEVRLEEINEQIDLNSAKLENEVGSSKKNDTIDEIIKLNRTLYDNLIAGSNKYYSYAEQILAEIPAQYHDAVKDGSIDIELFKGEANEKVLEAIEEYRDWVQKGADATQQAEEVLTEIADLAKDAFDNIVEDYGNKTSIGDSKKDQLDAYNALLETDLGSESEKIYEAMIKETNKNIGILENQRNAMQAELDKRVESGEIKKYSQHWYDAVNEISEVDTQIIELTTDIEDYQDSINELHWDNFDNLIDRLEMVADEADNLIDILNSKDLVDKDTAEWTDEGITALGLYAQQMEVAEMQAKKYKDEIDYLNKNWKKLGYTEQEYVEKLDELKSGQYDAIKAYNDTKEAIKDLNQERIDAIKEGIEKEIEAYEELIDKKKEELDAEKDLHDFQKGVADQQKEIADIERKLAALSSDNSASARAQRAKLQAELSEAQAALEEQYYERSIQDQQDALDKELENFQEAKDKEMEGLDEYLENTEQVVSDSLAIVQANTNLVYQTLQSMGQEYSLSITEALTSPWADGEKAIQDYSEQFGLAMSSTVEELQNLAAEYKKVMAEIDSYGKNAVDKVNENAQTYQGASSSGNNSNSSSSVAGLISGLSGNIKYGDTGSNVKKLQQALNELGYGNSGTSSVDGIFGDKTLSAVKKFQSAMEISADGIVGTETKKKFKLKGYANGSKGIKEDQLALIDELGEELVITPSNGRVKFLKKDSGIIPANLTSNLMEWGKLDPSVMLDQNRPKIEASPSIVNNNMEISIDASVGELIHVDQLNGNNLAEVTKIVDKAWDKYMKELNGHIRRYTR